MSTDPVQSVLEAIAKIIDGDAIMRTLCGRTPGPNVDGLAIPFESLIVGQQLPVNVFQPMGTRPHANLDAQTLTVEISAFASEASIANEMADRLQYLFFTPGVTPNAFTSNGASGTCQNPTAEPLRTWPGTQPESDDEAPCRADITLSFLLPD